jgi:HSP20 family molecular chaperone IbpA
MSSIPPSQLGSSNLSQPLTSHRRAKDALTSSDAGSDEREASRRISVAEQSIKDAENEAALGSEHIHDEFERSSAAELQRNEVTLESQRQKGYEELRNLKRAQQAEINRVKREGQDQMAELTHYYRDTTYNTEKKGEDRLQEISRNQAQEMEFYKGQKNMELEAGREDTASKVEGIKANQDRLLQESSEQAAKNYEKLRDQNDHATEEAAVKFQEKYDETLAKSDEILSRINAKAENQIQAVRKDTAQKLSAYTSRQEDPFYQLMDLGTQFKETDHAYILTATIPATEQGHVNITVKGDNLVLGGMRRNEQKMDSGPGHQVTTSAYQTFSESYKMPIPIEAAGIRKSFDGDQLTVFVPKKGSQTTYQNYKVPEHADKISRIRAEKPSFPNDLYVNADGNTDGPSQLGTAGRSGRPLGTS